MARGTLVYPAPPVRAASRRQVARAQQLLNQHGAALFLSGVFDSRTREALGKFQRRHGLRPTRKLDLPTRELLGMIEADLAVS